MTFRIGIDVLIHDFLKYFTQNREDGYWPIIVLSYVEPFLKTSVTLIWPI